MRIETLTRTLYTYEELSAPAQAKARQWYRDEFDYPWAKENRDSLEAFCQVFPVRAREWSYDPWSVSMQPVFTGDEGLAGLSGSRLLAHLQNRYNRPGVPLPVFGRRRCFRSTSRKRLSRLLVVETSCPFTGYHMDEVLLDPLRAFLRWPDSRRFEQLLSDCLWAWVRACQADWDSLWQDDAVAEAIIANGWEFTGEGLWADARFRWQAMA